MRAANLWHLLLKGLRCSRKDHAEQLLKILEVDRTARRARGGAPRVRRAARSSRPRTTLLLLNLLLEHSEEGLEILEGLLMLRVPLLESLVTILVAPAALLRASLLPLPRIGILVLLLLLLSLLKVFSMATTGHSKFSVIHAAFVLILQGLLGCH